MVAWEYGMLFADKLVGRFVPVRFALFGLIGGLGLVVHLATVWVALNLLAIGFSASQAIATMVAMTLNFVLNNQFTYRDQRLRGLKLVRGSSHLLPDLRDRSDRERRRCLLRIHLEPRLVAGGRGGSGCRLGLEFRDVVRFHLARTIVLKFDDGGRRSIAEDGYIVIWCDLAKRDASFQAAGSGGSSIGRWSDPGNRLRPLFSRRSIGLLPPRAGSTHAARAKARPQAE
jgi:hypothetical protein